MSSLADQAVDRWSVPLLADAVRSGALPAVELLRVCRERTEARNGELRAFVYLDWTAAQEAAAAVDAAIARWRGSRSG
jgi:Asp-tRNA(Asn)/Glu-tRNA(Gln) amidotransferase A subunit family amidase